MADIACSVCDTNLGWTYIQAQEPSQKYKEGGRMGWGDGGWAGGGVIRHVTSRHVMSPTVVYWVAAGCKARRWLARLVTESLCTPPCSHSLAAAAHQTPHTPAGKFILEKARVVKDGGW